MKLPQVVSRREWEAAQEQLQASEGVFDSDRQTLFFTRQQFQGSIS